MWHWAHQGTRSCDPWWENETEWHRAWKGQFPVHWQEIVHTAETGEKHIADVKTDRDWVIEFQHSYIKPEERRSRDAFYPKLVWVVNGTRRRRDRVQFANVWNEGLQLNSSVRLVDSDKCLLLKEWASSHWPIFFDFREEHVLWWLLHRSKNKDRLVYVAPFARADFIESHYVGATQEGQNFDDIVRGIGELDVRHELQLWDKALKRSEPKQPLRNFERYLYLKGKRQRRF